MVQGNQVVAGGGRLVPERYPLGVTCGWILAAVRRSASAEEVAEVTGLPLYRVRSGLREMAAARLVAEESGQSSVRVT